MVCSPNGLSPVGHLDNYGPFLGTQVEFPRVLLNSAGFIIYYSHHLLKMIFFYLNNLKGIYASSKTNVSLSLLHALYIKLTQ